MSLGFLQPSAILLQDIEDKWTLWLIYAGGDIAPPHQLNNNGADDRTAIPLCYAICDKYATRCQVQINHGPKRLRQSIFRPFGIR